MTSSVLVGIVGPTGSGKSALALRLAASFRGEIVGCDALQVYRGADIGTGKLTASEWKGIPHHLIDVADPSREFSAADYIRLAAPLVKDIDCRGKLPFVVGGTGLYLRALLRGLFEGPGRDPKLRKRITAVAGRRGGSFVHRMLARVDPESAERIHPNDMVRAVRALEVSLQAKRPMSDMMKERTSPLVGYRPILIGLAPPRRELARLIERRVQQMFGSGLIGEVRGLLDEHGPHAPVLKAIGYRQVAQHLAGEIDLPRAQYLTLTATLQYAKRQMTWFRREEGVVWFAGSGDDSEVAGMIEEYVRGRQTAFLPVGTMRPTEPIEAIEEEGVHAKTAS
jgi:tRNA dimethylallyltransferase